MSRLLDLLEAMEREERRLMSSADRFRYDIACKVVEVVKKIRQRQEDHPDPPQSTPEDE